MKMAREWWRVIDGCFMVVTGFSVLDAGITLASYSVSELFTIDKIGSLIVSIVVVCFWILRYRLAKQKSRKEQHLLDLEIKLRQMQYDRKDMEGEIDKLLDNDKWK